MVPSTSPPTTIGTLMTDSQPSELDQLMVVEDRA